MPLLSATAEHSVVFFNISTKPRRNKQPFHEIYLYHKADWNAVKAAVKSMSDSIISNQTSTVQLNWDKFQTKLTEIIQTHIPRKTVQGNRQLPWFNKELKSLGPVAGVFT